MLRIPCFFLLLLLIELKTCDRTIECMCMWIEMLSMGLCKKSVLNEQSCTCISIVTHSQMSHSYYGSISSFMLSRFRSLYGEYVYAWVYGCCRVNDVLMQNISIKHFIWFNDINNHSQQSTNWLNATLILILFFGNPGIQVCLPSSHYYYFFLCVLFCLESYAYAKCVAFGHFGQQFKIIWPTIICHGKISL